MPNSQKSEKEQNLGKFKTVIFIGDEIKIGTKIIKSASEGDESVKIINKKIQDIVDFSDLKGRTDENTLFLVIAHGANLLNRHFIDKKPTNEFFNELKNGLDQPIEAVLFSCYDGSALRMGGVIDQDITLMIVTSARHVTLVNEGVNGILKILKWKENGLFNKEIEVRLLKEDIETFYYSNNITGQIAKFPHIGKFDLEEVKNLLKASKFSLEQQEQIFQSFEMDFNEKNKKRFSVRAIKGKIDSLIFHLDQKDYYEFLKILEMKLQEKLSPDTIGIMLQNHTPDALEAQLESAKLEVDPFEILCLAASRQDVDMVRALIAQYPSIINKCDASGHTPLALMFIANNLNKLPITKQDRAMEIIWMLIAKGAEVDIKDNEGKTVLDHVDISEREEIIEFIKRIKHILNNEVTDFDYQKLKDYQVKLLAELLAESRTVTSIGFDNRPINTESVMALSYILEKNKSITEINLSYALIGDDGLRIITEALKQNATLNNINLSNNNIGYKGAVYFADNLIRGNNSLTNIDLGNNHIGSSGVEYIAEALEENQYLTHLDISRNNIDVHGIMALSKVLQGDTVLTNLDLSHNHMDLHEAIYLGQVLKENKSITNINLGGIGSDAIKVIKTALKQSGKVGIMRLK